MAWEQSLEASAFSGGVFTRYISRMFKSGVLTQGELTVSEEGVPQGSICSPVLANIYAHYVIDTWIEEMVKPASKGSVALFRYADDGVICSANNVPVVGHDDIGNG